MASSAEDTGAQTSATCFLGKEGSPAKHRGPRPRGLRSQGSKSSLCAHCPPAPLLIHILTIPTSAIPSQHTCPPLIFTTLTVSALTRPSPEQSLALAGVCLASQPPAATCARPELLLVASSHHHFPLSPSHLRSPSAPLLTVLTTPAGDLPSTNTQPLRPLGRASEWGVWAVHPGGAWLSAR